MIAMKGNDLLGIEIAGIKMKTPIIGASGTFGNCEEYNDFVDWEKIGAVCVKGLTLEPRQGNAGRRVAETAGGMMNCVRLQNPGVVVFITEILPRIRCYNTPIIVNINGNTIEDYAEMAEKLAKAYQNIIPDEAGLYFDDGFFKVRYGPFKSSSEYAKYVDILVQNKRH